MEHGRTKSGKAPDINNESEPFRYPISPMGENAFQAMSGGGVVGGYVGLIPKYFFLTAGTRGTEK